MTNFLVNCLLLLIKLNIFIWISNALSTSKPCNFQQIHDGVCVCNSTYCDTLDVPTLDCGEFMVITTSKNGKRFDITKSKMNTTGTSYKSNRWMELNENQTFQTIIGFGGALTDAASIVLETMNESIRESVYESYFSADFGANYNILRIPLGASDFSDQPWTYHEKPEYDAFLTNMTELLPHDIRRINQIKEMQLFAKDSKLKLTLVAWSPPTWMKTNRRWNGIGRLRPEYYSTWALYHTKALDLWKKEGLPFWSLSTGNEPIISGVTTFLNLLWRPSDLRRWVSTYLRPMLNEHGYSDIRLIGVDDLRSTLFSVATAFEKSWRNPHLVDLDMIGIHWYLDELSDGNEIDRALKRYEIPIIYTEGCEGARLNVHDMTRGPVLGSWQRAYAYVSKYIHNLKHGISGHIDWNLVLDTHGGPNYVRNFADSPMIFDKNTQTLYKNPIFYGIAHFSKFLHPDCVRISSNLSFYSRFNVDAVAFSCANSTKVVIMYNKNSSSEPISVNDTNFNQINLTLDPLSVNTLVYRTC